MMKHMLSFVIVTVIGFTLITQPTFAATEAAPKDKIQSTSVYMLNVETNTVIYDKNSEQAMDPGALVKMMTALLVLESVKESEMDRKVVCDPDIMENPKWGAAAAPVSQLVGGEEVSIRDLVASMMIQSACDVSDVLARYIGKHYLKGDENTFVQRMNERALELGCANTNFVNTHGLQDSQQVSTAADMAKIANAAVALHSFVKLSEPMYYEIKPTNKHSKGITLYGGNLMSSAVSEFYYRRASNLRIGRTTTGQQHLASVGSNSEFTYVLVEMGAPYKDKDHKETYGIYRDAEALFDWAFDTFTTRTVVKKGDVAWGAEIKVNLSMGKDYVLVVPAEEIILLLPRDLAVDTLMRVPVISEEVEAPIQREDVLGKLQVQQDDLVLASVDLVATEAVERSQTKWAWSRVWGVLTSTPAQVGFMLLLGLAVVFVLYTIDHNRRLQRKRMSRKRRSKR